MKVTKNPDGTITLTMTESDAKNLLFVSDDMAETYEDVASNLDPEDDGDPEFLQSVARTLTSMAGALFSTVMEEE